MNGLPYCKVRTGARGPRVGGTLLSRNPQVASPRPFSTTVRESIEEQSAGHGGVRTARDDPLQVRLGLPIPGFSGALEQHPEIRSGGTISRLPLPVSSRKRTPWNASSNRPRPFSSRPKSFHSQAVPGATPSASRYVRSAFAAPPELEDTPDPDWRGANSRPGWPRMASSCSRSSHKPSASPACSNSPPRAANRPKSEVRGSHSTRRAAARRGPPRDGSRAVTLPGAPPPGRRPPAPRQSATSAMRRHRGGRAWSALEQRDRSPVLGPSTPRPRAPSGNALVNSSESRRTR